MNVYQRFLSERGERRKVKEIPPTELDSLLGEFYITAKKKDKTEYEPDTLLYLDDNNARVNILKCEEFKRTQKAG